MMMVTLLVLFLVACTPGETKTQEVPPEVIAIDEVVEPVVEEEDVEEVVEEPVEPEVVEEEPEPTCETECTARKCETATCDATTEWKCVKEPEVPCCGNIICDEGESVESCSEDCKTLAQGVSFRDHQHFIFREFETEGLFLSPNNGSEALKYGKTINASYNLTGAKRVKPGIDLHVWKGSVSEYQEVRNNEREKRNLLKESNPKFKTIELEWRDYVIKTAYNKQAASVLCKGINSQVTGMSNIEIQKENTLITIIWYDCFNQQDMEDFLDEYLTLLSNPNSQSDIAYRNIG